MEKTEKCKKKCTIMRLFGKVIQSVGWSEDSRSEGRHQPPLTSPSRLNTSDIDGKSPPGAPSVNYQD